LRPGHPRGGRAPGAAPPRGGGWAGAPRPPRDGDGLAALLFSARAQVLLGTLPAAASLPYLSGLLIGDEIRSALAAGHGAGRLALIGDAALCARYRRALSHFGITDVPAIEGAAEAGLWRIACLAGLVIPEPVQETMP
ncbi:2-dehydro-3-deoxygalactonokinase, partial [Gluconacetobacter sp.]|uniref:2-dehydro-3-deoxygalactonokinase n=1 Tax=Gluconacetobacter sp. TaxID=1935994 RepID=UPI0039EA3E8F